MEIDMTIAYFNNYIAHVPFNLDGRDVILTCRYDYTGEEKPSFYSPGNGDYVEVLEIKIAEDIPGRRSPAIPADAQTFDRLYDNEEILDWILEDHRGYLSGAYED